MVWVSSDLYSSSVFRLLTQVQVKQNKKTPGEASASQKNPEARRPATARDELPTMRLSEIN